MQITIPMPMTMAYSYKLLVKENLVIGTFFKIDTATWDVGN